MSCSSVPKNSFKSKKNSLKINKLSKQKSESNRSLNFFTNKSFSKNFKQIKRPRLLDMHYTTVTQMPRPLLSQPMPTCNSDINNLPWHNNNIINDDAFNRNNGNISPWLNNPF